MFSLFNKNQKQIERFTVAVCNKNKIVDYNDVFFAGKSGFRENFNAYFCNSTFQIQIKLKI